jgi:alkaline phosphatase D
VWDDHEFADDSWQDHATHFNELQGDEKNTARRTAANRAWFEYQPADVTYQAGREYPDDLSIFRALRFGKHCEVFLTDLRSYRSDHVVPEGPENLDVGKFSANSGLGSRNFLLKSGFDDVEAANPGSMMGAEQKQWLIDGIGGSTATWKVWGNEVQVAQMLVDLSGFETLPDQFRDVFYFSVDQWDGYRTERSEVYGALSSVENLVALAGDIHAFYASELQLDFDDPGDPVAVEYVVSAISSASVQELSRRTIAGSEVLTALGLGELVPRFDELLGAASPHYKFASSGKNGVGIVDVTADAFDVTFLAIADPTQEIFDGDVERIHLRTLAGTNRIETVTS